MCCGIIFHQTVAKLLTRVKFYNGTCIMILQNMYICIRLDSILKFEVYAFKIHSFIDYIDYFLIKHCTKQNNFFNLPCISLILNGVSCFFYSVQY
jgi:hypothetical protein